MAPRAAGDVRYFGKAPARQNGNGKCNWPPERKSNSPVVCPLTPCQPQKILPRRERNLAALEAEADQAGAGVLVLQKDATVAVAGPALAGHMHRAGKRARAAIDLDRDGLHGRA